MFPEQLENYFALLWLHALVPPFLLVHHQRREGATLALAIGMVLPVGVEVGGLSRGSGSPLVDRQRVIVIPTP